MLNQSSWMAQILWPSYRSNSGAAKKMNIRNEKEDVGPWVKLDSPFRLHKRRVFFRERNGELRRIPTYKSKEVFRGWRKLPEFAGQTIEFFFVYLSMKNRVPIRVEFSEVMPIVFDQSGLVDQDELSMTVMNQLEPKTPRYFGALRIRPLTEEELLSIQTKLGLPN